MGRSNVWLNEAGQLTLLAKRHLVSTLNDYAFMALSSADIAETAAKQHRSSRDTNVRLLAARHMFAAVQQVILYAGRISALIVPMASRRRLSPELSALRNSRASYMESLFSDVAFTVLHERLVRNRIEHYDERVEEAVVEADPRANWVEDMVGPSFAIQFDENSPTIWQRRFDPDSWEFQLLGETIDVSVLVDDIRKVNNISSQQLALLMPPAGPPRSSFARMSRPSWARPPRPQR